ncbi:MAG: TauD/TfdA family dioxygenase [Gammaproteobacteria bacterium]|nr:TauD/TfdA family dioxygenase [Gammaproteobacteria bacterium]MDH5593382.1 TauD/TfdA family dioxygenase [Gammaproteobacteria bacterium]
MSPVVQIKVAPPQIDSPFHLDNEKGYQLWREQKRDNYPSKPEELLVSVSDPFHITVDERGQILSLCSKTNISIYRTSLEGVADKEIPRAIGHAFGLNRLDPNMLADDDGITSLQVVAGKSVRGYIPYSNKRLLWHTDGYYNTTEQQIRSIILHCVTPASGDGGENGLLDHEMAYILLRDRNPDFIQALMAPDAMTIPANEEAAEQDRKSVTGPVFSVDSSDGSLHMRYTARTRSIIWKDNEVTRKAVAFLGDLLENGNDYIFNYKLRAGEGLICNNVLHKRTAFENTEGADRLLYRARYYDRIKHT